MGISTAACNREALLELLKPSRRWCPIITLTESGITSSVLGRVRIICFFTSQNRFSGGNSVLEHPHAWSALNLCSTLKLIFICAQVLGYSSPSEVCKAALLRDVYICVHRGFVCNVFKYRVDTVRKGQERWWDKIVIRNLAVWKKGAGPCLAHKNRWTGATPSQAVLRDEGGNLEHGWLKNVTAAFSS